MTWYVYIAQFGNEFLYTGITTDIARRITEHNKGKGAKSLRGKGPVTLVYSEQVASQQEALKREREIKGWTRSKKIKLIKLKGLP